MAQSRENRACEQASFFFFSRDVVVASRAREQQRDVGAAEAERVAHHGVQVARYLVQYFNMRHRRRRHPPKSTTTTKNKLCTIEQKKSAGGRKQNRGEGGIRKQSPCPAQGEKLLCSYQLATQRQQRLRDIQGGTLAGKF